MQKWTNQLRLFYTVLLLVLYLGSAAQLSLSAQLRTRTEIRNGLGNLVLKGAAAAAFTSQRTRLSLGYKWDKMNFYLSLQDVRVWGQDAGTINAADGARLMLHEGWAAITLANKADSTIKFKWVDQLTLKIGRQELNYDDVRLIGNLDWLQQARRHDMALLKLEHKGWQLDIGEAFGQNTDAFGYAGTSYVPANVMPYIKNSEGVLVPTPAGLIPLTAGGSAANSSVKNGAPVFLNPPSTNGASQSYKSFTSVYFSKSFKQTKISGLFFNDRFGKYSLDSVFADGGVVYGRRFTSRGAADPFDYSGVSSRYTYGLMLNHAIGNATGKGKISFQAAYYQQRGKDRDGIGLSGYHYTLSAGFQKGKFAIAPGYDVLSGNNAAAPSGKNNRFDPLYGTPHRHWGFMDYFYVGTGSPAGGLNNAYLKSKYSAKKLIAGLDLHSFSLNNTMLKANGEKVGKKLGTEIDLLLNYTFSKFSTIELGYSYMHATSNMPFAKAQAITDAAAANYRKSGTWFYAMLKISPEFLFKTN
jgi:hypothetical protein